MKNIASAKSFTHFKAHWPVQDISTIFPLSDQQRESYFKCWISTMSHCNNKNNNVNTFFQGVQNGTMCLRVYTVVEWVEVEGRGEASLTFP